MVYGVSTDSEFVHLAWRKNHADLKDLPFPMLADIKRELSHGARHPRQERGRRLRATFIVDPEGIIRFVSVNDLTVGRNPRKCCACSTRCRPTSSAPATGRRAKTS